MAKPAQLTWPKIWDEATRKYLKELELAEKAHEHWYNKNKLKKEARETPPEMRSLNAFMAELDNQRKKFRDVEDKASTVLNSMAAIAKPLDLLMCQAGDIAGMFFPGAPLIFGAVMYIFHAGKGVKGYFGVIEQLFSGVTVFIENIRIHVQPERGLREELENVVIRALVKVLDILRIVTVAVKEKALKAFWDNLYKNKSGEAKAALNDLESLARERDSTVQALTLRSVDDIAEDVTEIKEIVHQIEGDVSEVKGEVLGVRSDLQGGFQSLGLEFSEIKRFITHLRPGGDQSDPKPRGKDGKDAKDAKEDRGEKDREDLVKYLEPDRTSSDRLAKLRKTTTPGTAEWILRDLEFEKWRTDSETPVLWVSGISGAGKSHLAAKMVEQLELMQKKTVQEGDVAKCRVASFFCDFETKESDEDIQMQDYEHLNIVLRTLAWQMTEKDRMYEKWLAPRMPNDRDPKTINELRDWQLWSRLFENEYFASLQKTSAFLVIDGVHTLSDACRSNLMDILHEFSAKKSYDPDNPPAENIAPAAVSPKSKLKVLILGQSKLDEEIRALFDVTQIHHIAVTEEKNKKDIEEYVSSSLSQSNKLKKLLKNEKFRLGTIEKVINASQGCFEVAALMVNELSQKDHLHSFSEALDNASRNIDQILRDILKHFGHTHTIQEIDDLNRLLAWVLYARRPLTLAEANAAAGLESDHGPFLNIRDKIEAEFSPYFAITDVVQNISSHMPEDSIIETPKESEEKDDELRTIQDTDNSTDSDASLLRLTHSSVARFFRSASKVEINTKGVSLGVTSDEAHTRLLRTCLKLLCTKKQDQTLGELSDPDALLKYAADHFIEHLLKLQTSLIPINEKESIVKYLFQLFRDDEVLDRWLDSLESLPEWSSMREVDQIWALISDESLSPSLSPEERAWITTPGTSKAQNILEPLAKSISRKWLQNAVSKREPYEFYYSLSYLKQLIDVAQKGTTDEATLLAQAPDFTSDNIHGVAEWAGLEKNALWHTQVARVPFAYSMTQDALTDCRTAIQLDKNFGDAYYYKAVCHADIEEYSTGISDMQEACRLGGHFEDNDKTIGARWISYWQEALKNPDGAIQVLEDALKQYPDDLETITQYVELATNIGRFKEVATCLQKLGSKLTDFLVSEKAESIQRYIRRAAQMTRRVNSLKKAYDAALKRAKHRRDDKEISRARKALFMITAENQEEDKAIELLKEVFRFEDGPKQIGEWGSYLGILYELLFWGAHLNGEGSKTSGEYLTSLIYAEKNEHSPDNNALTNDGYIGGLFLGQLYRLNGRTEESKVYFKDRIALAMSLLEDYDASNDWQAYDILSETLFKAGDEINGSAARTLFLHEWRKSQIDDVVAKPTDESSEDVVEKSSDEAKVSQESEPNKVETHEPGGVSDNATADSITIQAPPRIKTQDISVNETANGTLPANDSQISKMEVEKAQIAVPAPEIVNQDASDNKIEGDVKPVDGISTDTPWDYSGCDGPCLRDYDQSDKRIHVCMNCFDTTYCDICFNKYVYAGALPYKKCDPSHRFISVTGPPNDLDDTKVVVEGNYREREEWLNSIRRIWGLHEWYPVSPASAVSPTVPGGGFATIDTVVESATVTDTGEQTPK